MMLEKHQEKKQQDVLFLETMVVSKTQTVFTKKKTKKKTNRLIFGQCEERTKVNSATRPWRSSVPSKTNVKRRHGKTCENGRVVSLLISRKTIENPGNGFTPYMQCVWS